MPCSSTAMGEKKMGALNTLKYFCAGCADLCVGATFRRRDLKCDRAFKRVAEFNQQLILRRLADGKAA